MENNEDEVFKKLCECYAHTEIPSDREQSFVDVLPELNNIVIRSAQDAEYRSSLSVGTQWEKYLSQILDRVNATEYSTSFKDTFEHNPTPTLYIRLFRGYIILCRNLITVTESTINFDSATFKDIHYKCLLAFNKLNSCSKFSQDMKTQLYVSVLEFLSNLTTIGKYEVDNDLFFEPVIVFLSYNVELGDMCAPWLLYLINLSSKNHDFLYYTLKNESFTKNIIFEQLLSSASHIKHDFQNTVKTGGELTSLQALYVKLWYVIVTHESFPNFFYPLETTNCKIFMDILTISTTIVSSKEAWDNFEVTNVMVWIYKEFDEVITQIAEYFLSKSQETQEGEPPLVEHYYEKLICILDMMSSLCKFEHIRKFMHFYKGLDKLIKLLHILEQNCVKLNITKGPEEGQIIGVKDNKGLDKIDFANNKIKAINFPHCKSFIIEIISYLTYNNKDVQDQVRILNALEVILSNCIIDDNEPFIKERSIVCLRYLLTENEENQKLVAQLEAQTPVQDTVLNEAGFEIDINDDGKVGLKKRKL